MKARDTVMSRKIYEGDTVYEERVKQAEISFRAGVKEVWGDGVIQHAFDEGKLVGRKEVVDFINNWQAIEIDDGNIYRWAFPLTMRDALQAKLKEWGF